MANIIMIKIYSATCEHHNGLKNKYVVVYDNSTKRIYNIDKMCNKHKVFLNTSIMTHVEKNGAVYDKYEQPTETPTTEQTEEQQTEVQQTENTTFKYTDTDSTSVEVDNYGVGGYVGDAKETLNNMFGLPTEEIKHAVEEAKKAGVCYPYDENTDCQDCKDCINLYDCSFRGELARDEKCEMKMPVELFIETPLLLNIKLILEKLFERVENFKASYTWTFDNGNSSLRESKSNYYSIPKQSFIVFGDVYTIEFNVEFKKTSVYKYTHFTKNEKRVTLRTLKELYKKICNELKRKGLYKDDM